MTRVGQQPIAIAYMPWAGIKEELNVGPVSFWLFYSKAEEKILDSQVRADLTRFFETFVDNVSKPVRTVVACSCGDIGFRRFTSQEWSTIEAAVDCLIFATIASGTKNSVCSDNRSMAPSSADRFDLCARWVWPIENGLVVKTENSTNIWTYGEYKITRPTSVGGSFSGNYQPFLQGLGCIFDNGFPQDVRERLFRSLEWFRFAHTESTSVSWLHKIVMMSTAFEILLEFPDHGKTAHFVREIDLRMRLKDSYLVSRKDNKGNEYQVCMAADWAAKFYDLRSRIVHGETVTTEDLRYKDWLSHLIVADLVLRELVMRILYQYGCIGEKLRRHIAEMAPHSSDSTGVVEAALLPGILGLDLEGVHQALGWIPSLDKSCGDQ